MKQQIDYKVDYYDVLGVNKNATTKEIKSKYRILVQRNHPDKNKNSKATDVFLLIKEAYTVLSDVNLRRMYDSKFIPNNKKAAIRKEFKLDITFHESICGVKINTHMGIIDIPKGIKNKEKIIFLDNEIEVIVSAAIDYSREGDDLYTNFNINSILAMVGGKLNFTKITGETMSITIPKGTQHGDVIVFDGHGAFNRELSLYGNLYLKCILYTPLLTDKEIEDIMSVASLSKYHS